MQSHQTTRKPEADDVRGVVDDGDGGDEVGESTSVVLLLLVNGTDDDGRMVEEGVACVDDNADDDALLPSVSAPDSFLSLPFASDASLLMPDLRPPGTTEGRGAACPSSIISNTHKGPPS